MRFLLFFFVSFSLFSADDALNAEVNLTPIMFFKPTEVSVGGLTGNIFSVGERFDFIAKFPDAALGGRAEFFYYPINHSGILTWDREDFEQTSSSKIIIEELKNTELPISLKAQNLERDQVYLLEIRVSKDGRFSSLRSFIYFSTHVRIYAPVQTWEPETYTSLPLNYHSQSFIIANPWATTSQGLPFVDRKLSLEEYNAKNIVDHTKISVFSKERKHSQDLDEAILGEIGKGRTIEVELPIGLRANFQASLQRVDSLQKPNALFLKVPTEKSSRDQIFASSQEKFCFEIVKKTKNKHGNQIYILSIEILGDNLSSIHRIEHRIELKSHHFESSRALSHHQLIKKILKEERKKFNRD